MTTPVERRQETATEMKLWDQFSNSCRIWTVGEREKRTVFVRQLPVKREQTAAKPSNSRSGELNVLLALDGWSCLACHANLGS
jgi:hypothetical protein